MITFHFYGRGTHKPQTRTARSSRYARSILGRCGLKLSFNGHQPDGGREWLMWYDNNGFKSVVGYAYKP